MSEIPDVGVGLNAGAFMARAAAEGMGVVEARNAMRAGGLSMSNATFSRMYGEIRTAVSERDALQGLNYGAIPPGDVFTDWAAGAGGGYATFVTSYVRMPGSDDVQERFFTYTSTDPHTPQEAVDAAQAFYTDEALTVDSMQGGIYQGSMVTSVTRTVGGFSDG